MVQEKLSHEKEVQRKAETEKKDVELRDKILYAFLRHVSCIVSGAVRVVPDPKRNIPGTSRSCRLISTRGSTSGCTR